MFKILISLLLFCAGCQYNVMDENGPSDYQNELQQIAADIARLKQQPVANASQQDTFRYIYHLYRYASLTNNFADYKKTETALQAALERYGSSQQWYLFRANFNFKMHRLLAAKNDLSGLDRYGGSPQGEILKADIALQQGQYQIAEQAFSAISKENPSWDNLARLAYFKLHTGEGERADQLYEQAQNMLSVKQMRHFAWLELQRGIIDLEHKRYQQALEHYLRAEQAYSGYWLIREHIAEVYGLLGRQDEAIELYQKVIAQTGNPEFISELAVIYEAEQNPAAGQFFAQADELFNQQYRLFPEAAVGHFIESLLKRQHPSEQVLDYAVRNHQWRTNAHSKYLLAKAQQKLGNHSEARQLMNNVIDTHWWSSDIEILALELGLK